MRDSGAPGVFEEEGLFRLTRGCYFSLSCLLGRGSLLWLLPLTSGRRYRRQLPAQDFVLSAHSSEVIVECLNRVASEPEAPPPNLPPLLAGDGVHRGRSRRTNWCRVSPCVCQCVRVGIQASSAPCLSVSQSCDTAPGLVDSADAALPELHGCFLHTVWECHEVSCRA